MNEQKLSEKLQKFANRSQMDDGFIYSLDACFEWLVPKLTNTEMKVGYSSSGKAYCSAGITYAGQVYYCTPLQDTPALALCLAIEKLIDLGLTGKEVLEMKG